MLVIPSIDLEGGRAVKRIRGERGKYVFVGDPLELARRFSKAPLVHIVDLDGAETGTLANIDTAYSISKELEGRCQLGGGLRSLESIGRALEVCDYAVVSTLPFTDWALFKEALRLYGSLVVSLDVLNGYVMGGGWTKRLLKFDEAVERLRGLDLPAVIYTSINVEGTGAGPLFESVKALRDVADRVYYAGGVSNCSHLDVLKDAGFDGVVVGYALYRGDLSCVKDFEY
ncbi:MAG: 1-(5-phosphoribosyl)-5-[(5-phosphoribosylamino)methylideneamino] imidazole-4-carboxamide isomerase [Thermoproteus sp.]